MVAPLCLGIAERALQISLDYARTRVQFGKPIGDFQMVQSMLADMYVWVESMRLFTYQALRAANELEVGGGGRGEIHKITAASVVQGSADREGRRRLPRGGEGARRGRAARRRRRRAGGLLHAQLQGRPGDHRRGAGGAQVPDGGRHRPRRHGRGQHAHPGVAGDKVVLNGWGVGEVHWGGLAQRARVKGDWLVPLPAAFTRARRWPSAPPATPRCCA
jgi:hypothetical protein